MIEAVPEASRAEALSRLLSIGVEGGSDPSIGADDRAGPKPSTRRYGGAPRCWGAAGLAKCPVAWSTSGSPPAARRWSLAAFTSSSVSGWGGFWRPVVVVAWPRPWSRDPLPRRLGPLLDRDSNGLPTWSGWELRCGTAPASRLQLHPCSAAELARLQAVSAKTCEGSLDCQVCPPVAISSDESFHSYRYRSHQNCQHWYLLRDPEPRIVGCLILDSPRAGEPLDLLYLGVIPSGPRARVRRGDFADGSIHRRATGATAHVGGGRGELAGVAKLPPGRLPGLCTAAAICQTTRLTLCPRMRGS